MTEGNDDGHNLVRVRAQVMMRDDSTGGWVPMGGGGLSNVSVLKRISHSDLDNIKHEYLIYGKRISDQTVVFSCAIKKDFEYNKVMPTFHHWRTGDHKYGLTFQTAADGRLFDKGVRAAVTDLMHGLNEILPSRYVHPLDAGDDDVFMAVNLPVERDGSLSSSGSATTCSNSSRHTPTTASLPTPDHPHHHTNTATNTPRTTPDLPLHHFHHHHRHLHHHAHHHVPHSSGANTPVCVTTTNTSPASTISNPTTIGCSGSLNYPHLTHPPHHRTSYTPRGKHTPSPNNGLEKSCNEGKGDHEKIQVLSESCYVDFHKNPPPFHEYSYPMMDKCERRDSIASLKKQQQLELVSQTTFHQMPGKRSKKKDRHNKLIKGRCKYCNDTFTEEFNARGSCEFSPDYVRTAIDRLTCISCARCMVYHCMSNAEGEFPNHPCECDGNDDKCGRRWIGLTLLSLLVPCLCCYLPLRGCHRCAVSCGLCGGRHEAS